MLMQNKWCYGPRDKSRTFSKLNEIVFFILYRNILNNVLCLREN